MVQGLWVRAPHLCAMGDLGDAPKSSLQLKGWGEDKVELPVPPVHKLAHKQPVSGGCEWTFGFGAWKETKSLHSHSALLQRSRQLLLLKADLRFAFMHYSPQLAGRQILHLKKK